MTILVSIDGTGSSDWSDDMRRASHVKRLHDEHPGMDRRDKLYVNGPDDAGFKTGAILDWALFFLQHRIGFGKWMKGSVGFDVSTEPIDLVGYSRGGAIAAELAWQLAKRNFKVRFLGLFDAVDRDGWLTHSNPISNTVSRVAHAVRDPKRLSREAPQGALLVSLPAVNNKIGGVSMAMQTSTASQGLPLTQRVQLPFGFGHTATDSSLPTRYTQKSFFASHGALGGVHSDEAKFDPQASAAAVAFRKQFGPNFDQVNGGYALEFVRKAARDAGMFDR